MSEKDQKQRKFPCVYMRGGTSKAVFFHQEDLPADENEWPEIFMKVMGTPDVKQIDGMGGTVSSTSKIAVIKVRSSGHRCGLYLPSGGYRDPACGWFCELWKYFFGRRSVCDR